MSEEFKVGDRVQTAIGTLGTVIEPDFDMPLHHLVLLDNANKLYILKRILQPATLQDSARQIEKTAKSKRKRT